MITVIKYKAVLSKESTMPICMYVCTKVGNSRFLKQKSNRNTSACHGREQNINYTI